MATALPHPESLFISAAEREAAQTKPEVAKAAPTIGDKIQRLKKKRELATDLQAMIAQSGLTIDELREALRGQ
ncbi:hypothetical protein HQ393_05580 [Chitinibacter bivalviorum]|uniref:Uncharacterized protein n=1 Tax=Chitinibacter bivalviorum TaxID=2739434 RepID=A0A7H9BHT2_9NEIS|nr:hypothetical protein [Chitinibacter bivalviorum]QLG87768.1 hypothetical protein HQ393_05580 [Chitinibacter bivalviorum]